MHAIEFETDIIDDMIKIPQGKCIDMRHVRVILLAEEQTKGEGIVADGCLDFSNYCVSSFRNVDPVKYQREVRDEWK